MTAEALPQGIIRVKVGAHGALEHVWVEVDSKPVAILAVKGFGIEASTTSLASLLLHTDLQYARIEQAEPDPGRFP